MITIIFVGGDERQTRALAGLHLPSDLEVVSVQPCWNSNNNKTLAAVDRAADNADALAISTDVRRELGKDLRRLARKRGIPWVAGRARGCGAIRRLIDQACDLTVAKKATRRRRGC